MMRLLFSLAVAVLAAAAPLPSFANGDRVVAVVNDQVITHKQLEQRVELVLRQAGIASTDKTRRDAVAKRTLGTLIDEELQRQFAEKNKMPVTREDIARAREESIQMMGAGAWDKLTKGLEGAVNDKLAAEVRWQRLLARSVRPSVNVSTAEADRLIEELSKSRHVLEREISMIMLHSSDGGNEAELLKRIGEIRDRVASGAKFDEEAKAYSEDKSAVNGGRLGWFSVGELNPQLEEALDKMQPGEVSQPIKTPLGWHLVKLENVRTTKPVESTTPVTQYETFLLAAEKPADEAKAKEISAALATAAASIQQPDQVRAYFGARQYGETFAASSALGFVAAGDLQPPLAETLAKLKPGQWSDELSVGPLMARLYVAGSQQAMPRNLEAYRAKVMENLAAQRTELAARRFMRELRQRSFVDVRL